MSTAESILPVPRLPRPTVTAWVLSALVHGTLLVGIGALPFTNAQPGAFREMEVTLSGVAPAAARRRAGRGHDHSSGQPHAGRQHRAGKRR